MSKEPIIREKHREVLKKMVENRGLSRGEAMREVGYKEGYIQDGNIAQTDSWQALLAEELPDGLLTKVHKEGLAANRVISAIKGTDANGGTTDFIEVPDHATRHKYLETGYKIKGKLKDKDHQDTRILIVLPQEIIEKNSLLSDIAS